MLIRAGALGAGRPDRDTAVSRQHRVLVRGPAAELMFGDSEVLVRAIHLTALPGVEAVTVPRVTCVHVVFDDHEVICGDGLWSESFQAGDRAMDGLGAAQQAEILSIFPDVAGLAPALPQVAARPTLRAQEARALLARVAAGAGAMPASPGLAC